MAWEPKPEVVEAMARWLYRKENPNILDYEADERAAEPKRPVTTSKDEVIRTDYEARARQMLIIARTNSGSGG